MLSKNRLLLPSSSLKAHNPESSYVDSLLPPLRIRIIRIAKAPPANFITKLAIEVSWKRESQSLSAESLPPCCFAIKLPASQYSVGDTIIQPHPGLAMRLAIRIDYEIKFPAEDAPLDKFAIIHSRMIFELAKAAQLIRLPVHCFGCDNLRHGEGGQ
jgi:hypothetical protein